MPRHGGRIRGSALRIVHPTDIITEHTRPEGVGDTGGALRIFGRCAPTCRPEEALFNGGGFSVKLMRCQTWLGNTNHSNMFLRISFCYEPTRCPGDAQAMLFSMLPGGSRVLNFSISNAE